MEPQENTVASAPEDVVETVEIDSVEQPVIADTKTTQPVISASEPTLLIAATTTETSDPEFAAETAPSQSESTQADLPEADTLQVNDDLWRQVTHKWDKYFGKDKKSNGPIAIAAIAIIPTIIAISALLDFLNKLPLLSGLFELVGFGYSGWFVYRYLLLASTRKELTDVIDAWKNKVLG